MATLDAPNRAGAGSAQIPNRPLWQHRDPREKPVSFGGRGKPVNQDGFSDHFPITWTVTEDE